MNYVILGTGVIPYQLNLLKQKADFCFLTAQELIDSAITFKKNDKVYISSEAALQSVLSKLADSDRKQTLLTLKDKNACRHVLKTIYPNFYFQEIDLQDVPHITLTKQKQYVIKPKRGFFNVGVKTVNGKTNLEDLYKTISGELTTNTKYFSEDVLSATKLLIEEYIPGVEFAVDMYYSATGKPVIVNIYKHPEPTNLAYFNVLYYSEEAFFTKYLHRFTEIFSKLNEQLRACSLPIHAEFKLTDNDFIPIEFNPMRFGGMGLADLTYYAYGFNPFVGFFTDFEPDWKKIWQQRKNNYYAWILAYNGTNVNIKTQKPNHKKFKQQLGKILHYNELDYKTLPVFANAYTEVNRNKLTEYLNLDFNEFFDK